MRREKYFLQQVFRLIASDKPAGESKQTRGMLPVHLLKRARRVLAAPFRQG